MSRQLNSTPPAPYFPVQAIRIVSIDSYMSSPIQGLDVMYSEFRGSSVSQVPILRLFGSIPTGEKICVHIHGVFPYIYIPYDGTQDANTFMYRIAGCIDRAVNISLNQATSNMQHVYKVALVSGIPMYGYHTKEHQFFKIYLYNPLLVRKVTALLTNETTLGNVYQPHEAHLNFTLQFMMDYNLHGMSNMNLSKIKYRHDDNNASNDLNLDPDSFLPRTVSRITVCQLEGDCLAEDIMNRLEIASGNIAANPGISALWEDEKQRRRNKGMGSQIEHLLELKLTDLPPTKSHLIYKQALGDRLAGFSNEKNVLDKLNCSVYPAETPDSSNIKNSLTPSSLDSISMGSSNDLDETVIPTDKSSLSISLDQDAQELFKILNDLGNTSVASASGLDETVISADKSSVNISLDQDAQQLFKILNELEENAKELEEDSILTQVSKENEQERGIDSDDLDFSMSLEAVTTPIKIISKEHDSEGSDDDVWNTTLIPQVDGGCDESIEDLNGYTELFKTRTKQEKRKFGLFPSKRLHNVFHVKIIKRGRDMPDLDSDIEFQNYYNTAKSVLSRPPVLLTKVSSKTAGTVKKRNTYKVPNKHRRCGTLRKLAWKEKKDKERQKTLKEVRAFENRIKKLKRQDQLAAIIRKLHRKDNELIFFINKTGRAKFRVIPKDEVKALLPKKVIDRTKTSKVNVLNDIIVKIANYVDPTLHLTVKYPNLCCYIYNYSGQCFPAVTKIPGKVCRSYNKNDIVSYVKEQVSSTNGFKEEKVDVTDPIIKDEDRFTLTESFNTSVRDKHEINAKPEVNHEDLFVLSDKCLGDVKDPVLATTSLIRSKPDEEVLERSQNSKKLLQMYMNFLTAPKIKIEDITFSSEEHRWNVLNNIKCLKTKDELLEETFEENNNSEMNDSCSGADTFYGVTVSSNKNESKMKAEACVPEIQNVNCFLHFNFKYKSGFVSGNENDKTFNGCKRKKICSSTPRRSERINNLLKQSCPLLLDGAFDSQSSSEEEQPTRKSKRTCGTPRIDCRYKALPISVQKSPKLLKCEPAVNDLVSSTETSQKTPPPISSVLSQNSVCDASVKRQLFEKDIEPIFQTTVIEEKLVCNYSSNIIPANRIIDVTKQTVHYESNIDTTSNSSTIFSTDSDNLEKSFFTSQISKTTKFTAAEKYDTDTNYRAKEGCSKYLTPQSSQNVSQDKSSGSSSSDIITPYQQPKLHNIDGPGTIFEGNEIKEDVNSETKLQHSQIITLAPKFNAPTRADVLKSLDALKIPHVKSQEPFYSNVEDVTGSVEVGFNVLKISSKTTAHLPEFESQTDSLRSFRKFRLEQLPSSIKLTKPNMNNVILSYCKNRECIITPVKRPPSLKVIQDWIVKKSKRASTPENHKEKIKIYVPLSPGANSDEEMNLSLTLSPLTPKSSQTSQSATGNTPKSSETVETTSPTFRENYKKRKKEIRDRVFTRSVRKSLTLSQDQSGHYSGQITGVTVNSSLDKSAHNLQNARAIIEHQNLTVIVMELHIRTRGDFKPDPAYDSIRAIFYSILHDVPEPNLKGSSCRGVIAIDNVPLSPGTREVPILDGIGIDCDITYVDSEDNLINQLLKLIEYWDPDIFAGYEIELLSWGYLIERGYTLNMNLKPLLGRTRENNKKQREDESSTELRLTGRIVLDVWRLMRYEIALQSYTFESIAYHILHKQFPHYSFKDLSFWWDHRTQLYRHQTVKYYLIRVVTVLELFDKLDFLGRTSELARLFGIQFFEVLSRGSQFRVESMMLRLAKPLNFIAVSPSVQQRAHMKAPEYIPLVMEPESKLYTDPVIVLDFQSLYPSIIIAYNYCFTTCIGKVECLGKTGPFQFGATQLKVSRSRLKKLFERNQLNFSPCGAGFVKKEVRDGILPRMLREILDTRLMVKNSMKENKEDKVLQKVLHNRQLGLKLIANVTYGYTAANFSGRMPSVEIGDSVVSKGRETLQRAIALVDNTPEWGARVVYGDTDSLFVLVPGRTKEHAFAIGKKIADAVTNDNPDPVKLKLEKVYQPCILQTKKRYVGYMYENPDQKEPVYDAKGIETVRRDGCPAVSKMLEKCLRILFETMNVSLVKKYVLKQFNKIIAGRVSIQDLTFAKEYRGAAGYRPGSCVPALELTKKWTAADKRNEPRSGERVPYVIVNGPPGLPLIRMVRSPRDLIADVSLKPNAQYYITRVIIPPINRCFNLLGADANTWFNQMPRKKTQYLPGSVSPKKKSTISQYFSTSTCVSCEEQTQIGICQNCQSQPQSTVVTLMEKMRNWERNYHRAVMVCHTCTSSVTEVKCISLDCPIYYRRIQTSRDEQQTTYIRQLLSSNELF